MAAILAGGSAALAAEPAKGKTAPAPGMAAKVLELTGAETRIVWLRPLTSRTECNTNLGIRFSCFSSP